MNFWSNCKVLVTGSNGFAGSSLCRNLIEQGCNVFALVRDHSNLYNLRSILSKIKLVYGDVRYPELMDRVTENMDYVFNLASVATISETRKNPFETIRTNSGGSYNVAQACLKNKVKRLIHISTCNIYGLIDPKSIPLTEEQEPQPIDIYSAAKYSGEFFVRSCILEGLDSVITRAFNHYGPGQTGDFIVPKIISNLILNNPLYLGASNTTRDFTYVDDTIQGYMLAGEKGKTGEIYHFSSEKEITINELFDQINKNFSNQLKPSWESPREHDLNRSCGNSQKARKELDWKPKTSFEDGIKKTIEWNREFLKNSS